MSYTLTTRFAPGDTVLLHEKPYQVASITVDIFGTVYYGIDAWDMSGPTDKDGPLWIVPGSRRVIEESDVKRFTPWVMNLDPFCTGPNKPGYLYALLEMSHSFGSTTWCASVWSYVGGPSYRVSTTEHDMTDPYVFGYSMLRAEGGV